MPATNFIIDKRRSSRKRFRMGHRHDDNTNSSANEVRNLLNPYDDWDEAINTKLLAKIEAENPLYESIEEEDEGLSNDFNNTINPARRTSAILGISNNNFGSTNNNNNSSTNHTSEYIPNLIQDQTTVTPGITTHQRNQFKIGNFALTPEGKFDHVFERKIREQLRNLIGEHVKSEQIDCNDRSMYTGLPGISLLYHHLTTKQCLDTKFREDLAAKTTHHVNQYLVSIQTAHMHNSKCPSFLCGDLGIYTFCALARAQQRLHREMLTRTLSYPGPGPVLSQSAPPTPGVLGSELASGQNHHHHHHHHHHHLHNQMPPFSGVEQINSEPDTSVLLEKILELIKMQEQPGTPDELLYGRTGGLYAMLLIKQQLPKQTIIKDEHILNHINLMLTSGKTMESFGRPLFYSWHGKEYVGAAHGYAGILYMLLEAHKYLNSDQLALIKEAINFIQGIKYPSGNYPSSIGGQTDRLVHWCHGAPGVVHLLIKAYLVYRDESYLQSALACGDLIWQRGILKKGFSLCHGISGNAYAFLHLYQLTHDLKHLYRAGKFAQYYFEHSDQITWRADSPASLFEGYAGLAYFLSDLLNPSEAKFPAFQVTPSAPISI